MPLKWLFSLLLLQLILAFPIPSHSDSPFSTHSIVKSPFGLALAGDSGASPMETHLCNHCQRSLFCGRCRCWRGTHVIVPLLRLVPEISMMCAAPRCRTTQQLSTQATTRRRCSRATGTDLGRKRGCVRRFEAQALSERRRSRHRRLISWHSRCVTLKINLIQCHLVICSELILLMHVESLMSTCSSCSQVLAHCFRQRKSTDHRNAAECYSYGRLIVVIHRMGAQNWTKWTQTGDEAAKTLHFFSFAFNMNFASVEEFQRNDGLNSQMPPTASALTALDCLAMNSLRFSIVIWRPTGVGGHIKSIQL